ncbi:zinc finger, CCHC-type containing protein [Tanacetum coccineum]
MCRSNHDFAKTILAVVLGGHIWPKPVVRFLARSTSPDSSFYTNIRESSSSPSHPQFHNIQASGQEKVSQLSHGFLDAVTLSSLEMVVLQVVKMVEKTKGGARKEVVTREYTINLHKRLHRCDTGISNNQVINNKGLLLRNHRPAIAAYTTLIHVHIPEPKMNNQTVNSLVFRSFFEKEKLYGPNFINWYRNLRIVLSAEDKLTYLEHPIPAAYVPAPRQQLPLDTLAAHNRIENYVSQHAKQEFLQTVRALHAYKQEEVSLVLITLSKEYDGFVQNYNMHGMGKIVNELHVILKLHEQTLPKKDFALALHAIRADRSMEKELSQYLNELMKKKKQAQGASTLGSLNLYVGNGHRAAVLEVFIYVSLVD